MMYVPGVQAEFITFTDKADFLFITGATNVTGMLPDIGAISGGANGVQSVGSVIFSVAAPSLGFFMGTNEVAGVTNNDWTLRLPGPDIAISAGENLNMTLSGPAFSVGFDIAEPENDPNVDSFVDSTFMVTLKNDELFVDSFMFNPPNDTAAFFGVWGDIVFDRIEIRETIGGNDDEFFGQVYAGSSAIPEPSTYMLFLTLLTGLVFLRHKRWESIAEM